MIPSSPFWLNALNSHVRGSFGSTRRSPTFRAPRAHARLSRAVYMKVELTNRAALSSSNLIAFLRADTVGSYRRWLHLTIQVCTQQLSTVVQLVQRFIPSSSDPPLSASWL